MKKRSALFAFVLTSAILLAGAAPASAQIVIKMGTVAPEGSPWHQALLEMQQRWKDLSGGKVDLRIYAGGVAGDEPDMLRKMKIGQLHAAFMTCVKLQSVVPDVEAPSFPMMIQTDDELDYVIQKIRPILEKQLEEKEFMALNWTSAGWVHFFAKEPVVTPEDMRKRKLFFWGSDITYIDLLKNSGFNPIPLAVTDLLPSLQTGLVDAFASPSEAALAFQWYAVATHMTDLRWQPLLGVTVITTRKWNEIPDDLKPKLLQAANEIGVELAKKDRALETQAVSVMVEHGLKIHAVPEAAMKEWQTLVQDKGVPAFVGPRFSKEMYDRIQGILAEYRAQPKSSEPAKAAP